MTLNQVSKEQFIKAINEAVEATNKAKPNNYVWTHRKRMEFYAFIESKINKASNEENIRN